MRVVGSRIDATGNGRETMGRTMPGRTGKKATKAIPKIAYDPRDKRTPGQRMADETKSMHAMAADLGMTFDKRSKTSGT